MKTHSCRLAALVAVAVGLTALASPASADLPDRQTVTESSDLTSDKKGIDVYCPDGTRVVGSGAQIAGIPEGSGSVVLDDVIPSLNKVRAYAYEARGGTEALWQITAWAVCGDPHGSSTTNSFETADTDDPKSAEVTCPDDKVVLGSGASITGGRGNVVIDAIIPTRKTVTATGLEVDFGYGEPWRIRAYAICGDEPGGRVIVGRETTDSSEDKPGSAPCPDGKVVFGAGFDIDDGAGETFISYLIPANESVLTFGMEDWDGGDGNGRDWSLRSYAICGTA